MARIRTIKPEFWRNEKLSALPEATHMLAAALLNYADDEGYFNANPRLIHAECSPLREPSTSIRDPLASLRDIGYIRLGEGEDGRRYGQVINFSDHQRVDRPKASKISVLSITWETVTKPRGLFDDASTTPRAKKPQEQGTGNREEEQGKERSRGSRFALTQPPDEWLEFARK